MNIHSENYKMVLSMEIERLSLIERYIECRESFEACCKLRELDNSAYASAFAEHAGRFGHCYQEHHEKYLQQLDEEILTLGGWELS